MLEIYLTGILNNTLLNVTHTAALLLYLEKIFTPVVETCTY